MMAGAPGAGDVLVQGPDGEVYVAQLEGWGFVVEDGAGHHVGVVDKHQHIAFFGQFDGASDLVGGDVVLGGG